MKDCVAFYKQQARACKLDVPWLQALKEEALDVFTELGFPTRAVEDWKYTSTESFLKQQFIGNSSSIESSRPPVILDRAILLSNGVWRGLDEIDCPKGVLAMPLLEACRAYPQKMKAYLTAAQPAQDGFHWLNTAMLERGLFIYIPPHVSVSLHLSHWQDKANQSVFSRQVVMLDEGSSLCLTEAFQGEADLCYFTSAITEAFLSEKSTLTHYKMQCESTSAYHVGDLRVHQAGSSLLKSHSFSLGGHWVRSDTNIKLQAPKAQCFMNGVYVGMGKQHIDHHTEVIHEAPDCQSEQDYKGILRGKARAVFNGRVRVEKEAVQTVAKQQNKNLLLSLGTEIDTKPQLDIFADDVICTHGATVGQLDEEALFYLATRGIDTALATQYLVQAFLVENMRAIEESTLLPWVSDLITAWLEEA